MARYVAALADGGANEHGRVLDPATLATMFQPHYQTDPRVPGIGLAFMRSYFGAHLAVEHQGVLPGFNSQRGPPRLATLMRRAWPATGSALAAGMGTGHRTRRCPR
jgi:hypothetical protein